MATINGSNGDDVRNGTPDNDTINGLAGGDAINGSGGDDLIDGGAGDDVIYGDAGTGGSDPGLDASPLTLDISQVRPGSATSSGNNNDVPGDSVLYDNLAFLEDGTAVYGKLVLVSVSDSRLNVDLTGGDGSEILLNSGRGS